MTSGAKLNAISIQLGLLEKNIKQESLRLISEGVRPAVDDPGYHAFYLQLQQWSSRTELILRRLFLIKHEIAMTTPNPYAETRSSPGQAKSPVGRP